MKYSFYHITDPHYFSKKNYDGDPWALPQWNDQIAMRESEEILKKALAMILKDSETHTVIFTGDMTHHGDKESHEELTALLDKFESDGGDVYAFTDSHDYPDEMPVFRFDKDGKPYEKEHMEKGEVLPLYRKYNVSKAISVYEDGESFVAEIFPGLRFVALCYEKSQSGLNFSEDYKKWLKNQAADAEESGAVLFGGIHPPIIAPNPVYSVISRENAFENGEEVGAFLADIGLNLVFSGHCHMHGIQFSVSGENHPFYDVSTSSLVGCPPKMRRVTIDTELKMAEITTILMDLPERNLGMSLEQYCRKGFLGSLEVIPYNMEHDVEAFAETGGGISLPKEKILRHRKLVSRAGRFLNNFTFGKAEKIARLGNGLKKIECSSVKDKKVVPFLFDVICNIYSGDCYISPKSAEYQITMGVVSFIDSVIKILPIDIKKLTGFDSLKKIVKPVLFNEKIDHNNAVLNLKEPSL